MTRTTMILVFLLGIGFQSTAAQAQTTWHVECGDCADCPDPPGCVKENTFCSIQHAIDCASDGDEIIVAPGTCCETINFPIPPDGEPPIEITVRSSDGPAVTIIDGSGLDDSVVKCISGQGPDTVLEGFTITGGTGTRL